MKKITTILCSLAFMISGIMMAWQEVNPVVVTPTQDVAAATPIYIPTFNPTQLPLDVQMSLGIAQSKDTVRIVEHDTVQVTKIKWRKAPAPNPVVEVRHDTLYYIATQVGNKEGPSYQGDAVYEVHKVSDINHVTPNSPDIPGVTQDPPDINTSAECVCGSH